MGLQQFCIQKRTNTRPIYYYNALRACVDQTSYAVHAIEEKFVQVNYVQMNFNDG